MQKIANLQKNDFDFFTEWVTFVVFSVFYCEYNIGLCDLKVF